MAIERMKLLSITGREELIDSFITKYLLESGMQTENAAKVFEKGWKLKNFEYDNQARELSKKCTKLLDFLEIRYKEEETDEKESHAEPAGSTCLHCFNICVCCPGRKRMGWG